MIIIIDVNIVISALIKNGKSRELLIDSPLNYQKFLEEAKNILGKIDIEDVPYLALALYIKGDIWSDDNHFQKQKRIKIWKTEELVRLVDKSNFPKFIRKKSV